MCAAATLTVCVIDYLCLMGSVYQSLYMRDEGSQVDAESHCSVEVLWGLALAHALHSGSAFMVLSTASCDKLSSRNSKVGSGYLPL